jgi:hypothetical protein
MSKPRRETDWEAELLEDEKGIHKESGKPVVYLRGLQRLAEVAGIKSSSCQILTPSPKMVQAVYSVSFEDGTSWVGASDCSANNTDAPWLHHPTAVAESRAEARVLRKALGIRILSSEEIGMQGFESVEANPGQSAADSVVRAIESLCKTKNVDIIQVIEEVIEDPERALKITELRHLTATEAQGALAYLNARKDAPKRQTVAQKREQKKRELKGKAE